MYRIFTKGVYGLLMALLASSLDAADAMEASSLDVASVFTHGMVLQRGECIPVWGQASPGAMVSVSFAGQMQTAQADDSGRWALRLDPLAASAEPREFRVEALTKRSCSLHIRNVLVGEVWLCSGQSNMALCMPEVDDAQAEMAAADFPQIRMFRLKEAPGEIPWENAETEWVSCTPDTVGAFSAIGYYVAKQLHEELSVPVGIVVTAWGGSSVAAWMSRESLMEEGIRKQMPVDVIGWRVNIRPSKLFNSMLHPLIPYAMKGVIWYQGESDAEPEANPYLYRYLFPAMIADWRTRWRKPDWPFYYFQLPGLRGGGDGWAVLRESQAEALRLPHTGMITTLDIGQPDNLHPTNKKDFARRLAARILHEQYDREKTGRSPAYWTHAVHDGQVRVRVSNAGGGLITSDGTPPRGFQIAGEDRQFRDAEAVIDVDEILLSCSRVPVPRELRYAWEDNLSVNVCGPTGLPLTPFRTDNWPVQGEGDVWAEFPSRKQLQTTFSSVDIVSGNIPAWTWSGFPAFLERAPEENLIRILNPDVTQLLVSPQWVNGPEDRRPVLRWETTDDLSLQESGATFELNAQIFQASHPFQGLDIDIGLQQKTLSFKRYRLSIQPMRVNAFCGDEIRVLGSNLDNVAGFHTYRVAIQSDGHAQVYFDHVPLGVVVGEEVGHSVTNKSYFRWGKTQAGGEMTANIMRIAYDITGAYRPD